MMLRILSLVAIAGLLTACGGGSEQTVDFSARQKGQVYYSYPADEQSGVSVYAPVVMQFSEPPALADQDVSLVGPDGPVPVALSRADQDRSLIVTPRAPLAFNSDYRLQLDGMTLAGFSDGELAFTTGSAGKGPVSEQQQADTLTVTRFAPSGEEMRPLMDFSTLHVQFSQPLDVGTVEYGSSVRLEDGSGVLVEASALASGNRLTVDPANDLRPGQSYTLILDGALSGRFGTALSGDTEFAVKPQDSQPRETLALEAMAADPVRGCNEEGVTLSPLSGAPINCVPLIARLLGNTTVSKLSGDVFADLAFIPNYPDASPLRIRKGSLLKGEPLEVMIGGQLPAGFDSGEVTVSFLSDATGYLLPAPYSARPEAPRRLMLTLDLAFSTADSRANGAFTQTLVQVELVGRAIVEDGRMIIDALGVVEPEVLGIETAFGVLSFHMESYQDQENAPEPPVDITGPSLQSWQPGDYADRFRPGDPIVLNLSETPDQDSIEAGVSVTLTEQGAAVPFEWTLDGASLILTPEQPLAFGSEYQVTLTDGVEDLYGNPATPETLLFSMPAYSPDAPRTPYTTTVYPGFPCAVDPASRDLDNGIQGQCASAFQDQAGDLLPVDKMPANRAIEVQFSQDMDTSSMVLGQTCGEGSVRVEKIDSAGNCLEAVPGYLSRNPRSLTVIPAQPWEEGVLYQYVLGSHENTGCGQGVICSVAGMPLQTAQLLAPAADAGGPDMAIAFTGAPATGNVFLPLRNLPKADVNANFVIDSGEQKAVEDPPGSGDYPTPTNAASLFVAATGGLVTGAQVGCNLNLSCPGEKFTYLNGGINADIVGWNESEQAVEVLLYPPVLMTTNSSVYAQILGLVEPEVPTEPLVMRARYADDGSGNRTEPVRGYIRHDGNSLTFDTTLDLFLDAPEMEAPLGLPHNLHSLELNDLQLSGPVEFLPDGRLVIGLLSLNAQTIGVSIGDGAATIDLQIPVSGVNLTFQSGSIK